MLNISDLHPAAGDVHKPMSSAESALLGGVRLCHFHGNPNSYNAAISFLETGSLIRFHTSVYGPAGTRMRFNPGLPRNSVRTHPLWESLRLAATHLPFKKWN